jgi:hypothetical protein
MFLIFSLLSHDASTSVVRLVQPVIYPELRRVLIVIHDEGRVFRARTQVHEKQQRPYEEALHEGEFNVGVIS